MLIEAIVRNWKQARESLIKELEQIPAEEFDFRSASGTRSITEIVKHILESQKVFVSEVCQSGHDTDLQAVFAGVKRYQGEIAHINDKEGLISLLRTNMDWAENTVRAFGEELIQEETTRFDGIRVPRFETMNFMIGHEMYHCGQVTVYERMLGIEPALTVRFKKLTASQQQPE